MSESRIEVEALVRLLDHVMQEQASEFGWDHWHSLARNLSTLRSKDWNALPPGAGRTIRELVLHIGGTFLMYADRSFGDGSRERGDLVIDGQGPGETPEEIIAWLRAAHDALRDRIANLTDAQLDELRPAPWGEMFEARRLIELQIQHPLYHVGEINHIRTLLQGNDDWDHQDMGREAPA